jgi:hypothetical protein
MKYQERAMLNLKRGVGIVFGDKGEIGQTVPFETT